MKNVIYRITNTINNKVYIGLTTQGLEQRKREHFSRLNSGNRNHKIYQALNKYGKDNFIFEVIFCCFDKKDLPFYEKLFIEIYNSYNKGYNMSLGGETVSEETKLKLSKKFSGRKVTWYNKILESRKQNKEDKRQKFHLLLNSFGFIVEVWNLKEFCVLNNIDVFNLHHYKKKNRFLKGYLLLESSTTSLYDVGPK